MKRHASMRRCLVLAWLVGCSADGAGDDDQPPTEPPDMIGADDAAMDRDECDLAMSEVNCPTGWAKDYHNGPREEPTLGLRDIGEPVCNGQGVYVEPAFFEAVHADTIVGVTLVSNAQCSVVCYPKCRSGSVCWAERPDGEPCGDACTADGFTENECAAFVAECLGGDAATCEG